VRQGRETERGRERQGEIEREADRDRETDRERQVEKEKRRPTDLLERKSEEMEVKTDLGGMTGT
jgi:hypothetical protein